MKFIDEVQITVGSGKGGPGSVSFRRESMTPRGGPDGGNGGKGGDLLFKTSKHINSLVDFRNSKKYLAEDGKPGEADNRSGPNGKDLVLLVPEGTLIKNLEGEVLCDLSTSETTYHLKGGRGGKGNAFFKTSVNQAPEHAQPGEAGETMEVVLELKLIADVGIIGAPNAGKSTLISRISAARPKIADYPFTTLVPQLGVAKAGDYASFVVADIPGLIKDAHKGVGLGVQFLKHVERTSFFVHLVDASGLSGTDPIQDFEDIQHELRMYDSQNKNKVGFFPLEGRPQLVVLSKIDLINSQQLEKLKSEFKKKFKIEVMAISAVTNQNIKELLAKMADLVLAGRGVGP